MMNQRCAKDFYLNFEDDFESKVYSNIEFLPPQYFYDFRLKTG